MRKNLPEKIIIIKSFISSVFVLSLFFSGLFLLNGCQTTNDDKNSKLAYKALRSTISVNFSQDNRLWRLIPTKQAIYVDFSDDFGQSYSKSVKVNKLDQTISAWPENPPAIKISQSGRIYALYYADEQQKSTSFISYSDDDGQTFSTPALVSDHAQTNMHYMDQMLIDSEDKLFLFWHDTRHDSHKNEQINGSLSLYYSTKKTSDETPFENTFINNGICSCCRTAAAFDNKGNPVIFARMVYDNGVRDHALMRIKENEKWQVPQRTTYDEWNIEACPEHGPAITIDKNNRTHLTWFTLGEKRQGIFHAHTDDFGKTVSTPITLGNPNQRPSHPDIISLDQRVIIVWKEFDGEKTILQSKESFDQGNTWTEKAIGLTSKTNNSHPALVANKTDVFLSWTAEDAGHVILKL